MVPRWNLVEQLNTQIENPERQHTDIYSIVKMGIKPEESILIYNQ